MFTLANNVATFVVDRTGVILNGGVYSIQYDSSVYKDVVKLLDDGYTVVFKVVNKNNTTKKDSDVRYLTAIHKIETSEIRFLPSGRLASNGRFYFNPTEMNQNIGDMVTQINANTSDISDIKEDISGINEDIQSLGVQYDTLKKIYYKDFEFSPEWTAGTIGTRGFVTSIDASVSGYKHLGVINITNPATDVGHYEAGFMSIGNPNLLYVAGYRVTSSGIVPALIKVRVQYVPDSVTLENIGS